MRARTGFLGAIGLLAGADTAAIMSLGTHFTGGPHHAFRWIVCVLGAFMLSRRSARPANAAQAVATVFGAVALASLLSTTGYVLTGSAAANRHGPALLLTFMFVAGGVGLVGGVLGAAAGWVWARSPSSSFDIRSARVAEFVTGLVALYFAAGLPLSGATTAERALQIGLPSIGALALILAARFDPWTLRWRIAALLVSTLTLAWAALRLVNLAFVFSGEPPLVFAMLLLLLALVAQTWVAIVLYRSSQGRPATAPASVPAQPSHPTADRGDGT